MNSFVFYIVRSRSIFDANTDTERSTHGPDSVHSILATCNDAICAINGTDVDNNANNGAALCSIESGKVCRCTSATTAHRTSVHPNFSQHCTAVRSITSNKHNDCIRRGLLSLYAATSCLVFVPRGVLLSATSVQHKSYSTH